MKMLKIASILFFALFFVQPNFAQNNSRKVVATYINTVNLSLEEQDFLRDVNTYLHSVFENNDYALVSLDEADRDFANNLELLNFLDAQVHGKNGEAVDYVIILWLEHINEDVKVYSKKIGRINTDYKLGKPIIKNEALINYTVIRELIALELVEQYVILSPLNWSALDEKRKGEKLYLELATKNRQEWIELPTTKLMVMKEDIGYSDWESVKAMCENSILGGYKDWRLPTKDELMTIYTNRQYIGGFKTEVSNNNSMNYYWSISFGYHDNWGDYYYYVDFSKGALSQYGAVRSRARSGRCVRTIY